MSRGKEWTTKEISILREEYPTVIAKILAAKLGRTPLAVHQKAYALGLRKTVFTGRIIPGNANYLVSEIGASRVTPEGYTMVKVGKNDWRLKHRVLWEKERGAIPKGMHVSFRDGNRENCAIENLHLVSTRAQLARNSMHNLPEDLRKLIHMKSSLQLMINKRRKKHEQHADTAGSHIQDDGRPSDGTDNSSCGERLSCLIPGTD